MTTLFTIFFLALSISEICIISTIATSGFLVTAPKYLLIGSKEKICISIHKSESRTPVNIMLLNLNSDDVIATTTDFVKGNTSCLSLHIPLTTNATGGRLQVRLQPSSENELTNLSEQNVELKSDPLVTIIAVEKPIYRPGEVVRFRILSLTHKLKIDQSKLRRVWIESPNAITIEQWWNVKTDTGLAQLEISLSDECLLGSWKIKIQHFHNNFIEEKAFLVKEYVLPWFEVNVVQPKEILADTPEVTFEICAKYSYGAPVMGDVTVQLNLKTPQPNEQPKIIYDSKLDKWTGCSTVNVSSSGLLLTNQELQPNSVEMTATVTEATTKKSEKSVVDFQIYNSAVQLQFHCSEYFKPGLPYKGTVKVLSASGQPTIAVGLLIQICMREENPNKVLEYHKQCWNHSTDYSSEVVFTLPPRPNTTGLITLTAVSLEHKNKYFSDSNWRLLMVQPKATQELTPWFSPSRSYIDISTVSPVVCNMLHSFHVQYTVSEFSDPTPTFFYLVESRGDLLHIGNLKPENEKPMLFKVAEGFPPSRAFILPVLITPDMSPEARILVYYIRGDNEIVAASTIVLVDKCFPNNVRARWTEQTVWPGANVSLNIRAHPFSLCGLNIVDSMMMKRYSDEILSDRIIWKKLEVYKAPFIETPINFCRYDDETMISPVNRRKRMLYLRRPSNLYKDALTAFSDLGVVVLTDLTLETRPCSNYFPSPVSQSLDYLVPRVNRVGMDIIPDSNVNLLAAIGEPDNLEFNNTFELRRLKSNLVRTFFPEAWLWNITTIGELGETVLNINVPHSVTTWDANVFCVSNEVGFGMAEPPSITSFIPFFLMVSTPKTLIRTETLPVTVTIYNYLSHSLPVKIILSTSAGLNIVNEQNEISDCLTELSPKSYEFQIVAHKTGLLNITATAVVLPDLTNCSPGIYQGINDTMVKTVKVQAEGFPVSKFYSSLLCSNDHLKSFWDLSLPSNVINNTARATMTLSAELLGPALKSLGDLVEMPTGCGEQNMIKLAPNVHVLRYLKIVSIPDGEKIKEKAIMHIQKGYQKQLTYRHDDGSYSAFGPSFNHEESSIWLTAFVLSTFGQAKNLITIDNNSLKETLDWILSKQMENGCFQSVGYVFTYGLRGGLSGTDSPAALTAYIIASLYKSGLDFPSTVSTNAEFCLSAENSNSNTNIYSLSLITYAYAILNTTLPKTQDNLQKLKQLAKYDQDLTWWENPDDSMALKIETTGYAILSLLKVGGPENLVMAQKAVRWISTNRNNKGGFVSTQDTVVGLEALITFATTVPMDSRMSLLVNIIEVANDQTHIRTLSVDDSNAALQQRVRLVHLPSLVHAKTRGRGCALVQATLKYNVDKNSSGSGFELEVTTAPLSDFDECHFQKVEVCARYTLLEVSSSMAVIIINLPTGYVPDRDSLYQMTGIQRFDEDIEGNKLDVYLNEVRFIPTCFHFTIQRVHYVTNPAPAIVTIIDYYHPEHTQSVNYSVNCEETTPFTDTPDIISVPFIANIDNFNNVDHELDVPEGVEGPQPLYVLPPTSSSSQPLV